MSEKHTALLTYIFCAAMALLASGYILLFHYPLPMYEHLFLTQIMDKSILAGEVGVFDPGYITVQGGHWYLTGNWLGLILAKLTGWNIFWDSLLIIFFLCLGVSFVLRIISKLDITTKQKYILSAAAFFFLFSLDQSRNFLWHHQVSQFICLVCIYAGAYIYSQAGNSARKHVAVMVLATLATYSTAAGLVFTTLLCFFIWFRPVSKVIKISWLLLFAALLTHYIAALFYMNPPAQYWQTMPREYGFAMVPAMLKYMINSFGMGVSTVTSAGLVASIYIFGVLGIIISLYCATKMIRRFFKQDALFAIWILQLVSIGYFLLASVGRSTAFHNGIVDTGLSNSNLFWMSSIILLVYFSRFWHSFTQYIALAVLVPFAMFKVMSMEKLATTKLEHRQEVLQMVTNVKKHWPDVTPEMMKPLIWEENAEGIYSRLEYMYQHKYSIFKE